MKIFENTATTFTTNGLGPLPDATSAVVTEEINGIFELQFEYPITGLHYAEIKRNRLVVCKPNHYDPEQAFRIYSISKPIGGIVTVNARHIAASDLPGIILKPPTIYPGYLNGPSAVQTFLNTSSNYLNTNNFTFAIEPTSSNYCKVPVPMSVWELMGADEYQMLNAFGGEYQFNNFAVTLKTARGQNRGATLRYGKNITDFRQDESIEEVYTGVYPYYYNEDNGRVIGDVQSAGTFNYSKIMLLDCSGVDWFDLGYQNATDDQGNPKYEGAPTKQMLNTYAQDYIAKNNVGTPEVSMTISFVDLKRAGELDTVAELSRVQLGDTVKIVFPELLDSTAEAECTKTEYDVLTDSYESITLGDRTKNAADSLAYEAKVVSALDQQQDGLTIKLQATKDGLESEVSRAAGTEAELSSRITQTATAISTEVTNRQAGDASVLQQTASAISTEVTNRNNAISSAITQLANSISLSVTNQAKQSIITLTGEDITAQSQIIKFTGNVVFASDLSTSGSTTINGDNISTGTVSADRIDANNLKVKQLEAGTNTHGGTNYSFKVATDGTVSGNGHDIWVNDMVCVNDRVQADSITVGGYSGSGYTSYLYDSMAFRSHGSSPQPYAYCQSANTVSFSWTSNHELEVYIDGSRIGKLTIT